jgi:putative restriction endonuclease
MTLDLRVRAAAFAFLEEQTTLHGEVLPYEVLAKGFEFDGVRVPLISRQGIFKPKVLPDMPLTIKTVAPKDGRPPPYDDGLRPDGLLDYRYRGTDPNHPENVGLRRAMHRQAPLIYLFGIVPGRYLPIWPVYVVGDDPRRLTFVVAVDDHRFAAAELSDAATEIQRAYVTRVVVQRLHQRSFRERVLAAYREQCAMCRLRHAELLEAAHIIPDSEEGKAIVSNGLALCKLHHAAFDRHILGVRPDLVVEVRRDILEEVDGPMLRYGLQQLHGSRIIVPRSADLRPRREFLEARYERFRKAS